jgi:hypothetical protein
MGVQVLLLGEFILIHGLVHLMLDTTHLLVSQVDHPHLGLGLVQLGVLGVIGLVETVGVGVEDF